MARGYWLVKCEPHECSFDELKTRPKSTGNWRGVRNYQARNSIRDDMAKGDLAFFYHSNCDEPGIAGIVTISRSGYPDPSQFDNKDRYHDPKSKPDEPRWYSFDVKWKRRFKTFVHLADLKARAKLADMKVVQKGQRLSIQPVTAGEWTEVCRMGGVIPA
jgi:predicted RNA-binding protein with PUA-like domain